MKKTITRGFTLIELLVVISIISLLSSIVLASVSGAREKAMLTKTVGEMKSLQTALELYKNQFGIYPGEGSGINYDDDSSCIYTCGLNNTGSASDIHAFFTAELVNRKLLSSVPHAPRYPNNCTGSYLNCSRNGYVLGYSLYDNVGPYLLHKENNTANYFTCGDQRVRNYVIYFAANNKKLNLPLLGYYDVGVQDMTFVLGGEAGNVYCLAM